MIFYNPLQFPECPIASWRMITRSIWILRSPLKLFQDVIRSTDGISRRCYKILSFCKDPVGVSQLQSLFTRVSTRDGEILNSLICECLLPPSLLQIKTEIDVLLLRWSCSLLLANIHTTVGHQRKSSYIPIISCLFSRKSILELAVHCFCHLLFQYLINVIFQIMKYKQCSALDIMAAIQHKNRSNRNENSQHYSLTENYLSGKCLVIFVYIIARQRVICQDLGKSSI